MEDRGDKTSLSGLLMKLEGRHRNSLSSRWSWKWVTCSPTEISYYNKPAAPAAGQKPKKTFPIRDCVVRFDKDKRVIVVVGTLSRGSASSGDDGPYTAAFKCENTSTFARWSKVLCIIANVENGAPRFTEEEEYVDCTIDLNDSTYESEAEPSSLPLPPQSGGGGLLQGEQRMCGVLSKLEGHRKTFSPLNMSKRWRKKWVTCDKTQLCYYSTATEPKTTQQPRKSLLIKDCVLRFYKNRLMVEVEQLPQVGSAHTAPAPTYTITLKCGDTHEYDAWSKYLHSVVPARRVDMSGGSLGVLAHLLNHHPEVILVFFLSFFVARKLNSLPRSDGFFPTLPQPGDNWDDWDPLHELSRLLPLDELSGLLRSISRDALFAMIEPTFTMIGVAVVLRSLYRALMHTPPPKPKADRKLKKLLSTKRAPISPRRHSDSSITPVTLRHIDRANAAQQSGPTAPRHAWAPPGNPIQEHTEGEPQSAIQWRLPQGSEANLNRPPQSPPRDVRSPGFHNARRRLYT